MTKRLWLTRIVPVVLLAACSQQTPANAPEETAKPKAADTAAPHPPPVSEGFDAAIDDYVPGHKGAYELWQNLGDDGFMCELQLTDSRTIGGYAVEADEACLERIKVAGLFAWFIAPDDGHLVFIDPTRQPLMRLKPDANGVYYGNNEFYAIHDKT